MALYHEKHIWIAILVMGFSGLVAEILLLRELLIVFSGNELCIGIILANWLILEALGCFLIGRRVEKFKSTLELYAVITVLFSLSLPPAIFLTRILKTLIGVSIGESMGLLPMFYSSFLILLPVSLLHGALFPLCCRIFYMFSGNGSASSAGKVYAYETVGTMIGGIVCTYACVPYLDSFQSTIGLAFLNCIVCFVLLTASRKTGYLNQTLLVFLGIMILFSGYTVFSGQAEKLHQLSIKTQWRNQNIVHYQNSRYGNICILKNQEQYIFFLNGTPNLITPVPDMPFIEEFVHLPLLVHPEPAKLLILSGGAGGVISEAFKHSSIETIDYAELDPLLLDLLKKNPTPLTEEELNDSRVTIKKMDGRLFLKTTPHKYDVILLGILNPSNLQANRFFTEEFFSIVKTRLNKGGIIVLGLPGSLMYANEELKNLNSCIFHTLGSVFSYIRVIPGNGTNIFLSSDSKEISTIDRKQIVERLYLRNIRANTVAPWHIEKKMHHGWQDWFSRFIEGSNRKINSDFRPLGVFYSIAHWNALYAPSVRDFFRYFFERIGVTTFILVFILLLILYFLFRSKLRLFFSEGVSVSIITTGFAGMIFDLMIIFTFQSLYGYVFFWIGLFMASFMAGAACGALLISWVLNRIKNCYKLFIILDLAIIFITVGWPFLLPKVYEYIDSPIGLFFFRMLFLFISCTGGIFIGAQFPLANEIYLRNRNGLSRTAGLLYSYDLIGGWLGGILGAVLLLPLLGLTGTCITVGFVKLTSFILLITHFTVFLSGGKT
ncbi:MAG: fused MFS/spermidine synthase [Chitinispirillia bacterium]|jgi:spermidine synthase